MNKEATKYCEECKNCLFIEMKYDIYCVHCKYREHVFDSEIVYCKYKKVKKENKRNA